MGLTRLSDFGLRDSFGFRPSGFGTFNKISLTLEQPCGPSGKGLSARTQDAKVAPMQAGRSIQAVSFDVGGTLIEPWPSVGHVYAAAAGDHGHPGISPAALNHQFAEAWQRQIDFDHSRCAWQAVVEQTFVGLLVPHQAAALLDDLYQRFARAAAWRVYPDVVPTLGRLKALGLKLAVVSNWDERLRPLLADLELTPFFHAIVISAEVGATKPAPAIFQRCLKALGCPAQAVLHVGDSPREDLGGAARAGLRGLRVWRASGPVPPAAIAGLDEIFPRLATGFGLRDEIS
jgi:putative hydrolase of the HAD superfamily